MPLARDLHPELGYLGSPLSRRLGLVSASVLFGLMTWATSVAVFMTGPDPDPMKAMALASAEVSTLSPSASPAEAKAIEGQEILNASITPPPCRESVSERLGDVCTSARMHGSRPAPAMNERPAIAAVAIGHRDDPATLPPQSAIAVAAIPETPSDAAPADSGAAPSPAVAPEAKSVAPVVKQSRTRNRHVARREGSYSGRTGYSRQGYQAGGPGLW